MAADDRDSPELFKYKKGQKKNQTPGGRDGAAAAKKKRGGRNVAVKKVASSSSDSADQDQSMEYDVHSPTVKSPKGLAKQQKQER